MHSQLKKNKQEQQTTSSTNLWELMGKWLTIYEKQSEQAAVGFT